MQPMSKALFSEDKPPVAHFASMSLKVHDRFFQHFRAARTRILKNKSGRSVIKSRLSCKRVWQNRAASTYLG